MLAGSPHEQRAMPYDPSAVPFATPGCVSHTNPRSLLQTNLSIPALARAPRPILCRGEERIARSRHCCSPASGPSGSGTMAWITRICIAGCDSQRCSSGRFLRTPALCPEIARIVACGCRNAAVSEDQASLPLPAFLHESLAAGFPCQHKRISPASLRWVVHSTSRSTRVRRHRL
jgi:hypothetical protein